MEFLGPLSWWMAALSVQVFRYSGVRVFRCSSDRGRGRQEWLRKQMLCRCLMWMSGIRMSFTFGGGGGGEAGDIDCRDGAACEGAGDPVGLHCVRAAEDSGG